MRKDPAFGTKEPVQSVRASFELVGYDGIGVTLRMLVEGDSLDFHRSLHDLVRAGYQRSPRIPH